MLRLNPSQPSSLSSQENPHADSTQNNGHQPSPSQPIHARQITALDTDDDDDCRKSCPKLANCYVITVVALIGLGIASAAASLYESLHQ